MFSKKELQYRIIFAIIVAGKNAKFAEMAVKKLFNNYKGLPFNIIKEWVVLGTLGRHIREARTGNYNKIEKALSTLVNLNIDLATCSPAELEVVPGIGPKTSRFFVLWTRTDARVAVLDVHILRWLRNRGHSNIPKVTPAGKNYQRIEEIFLKEADDMGMTPRELDAKIWVEGSGFGKYNPDDLVAV